MKKSWFRVLALWVSVPLIVLMMACSGSSTAAGDDDDPEPESDNNFPQAEIEN